MGYEIVYQRAFLRTSTGIIPMVLAGSNNCYDTYLDRSGRQRQKRARSWFSIYNALTNLPEDQFRQWLREHPSDANHELFMYRSKWVTGNQEYDWFEAGIKAARTLEEYISWNPRLRVYCFLTVTRYLTVAHKEPTPCQVQEMEMYCFSTPELETWIKAAKDRTAILQQAEPGTVCSLRIFFTLEEELRIVPRITGPVAVMYSNGSYVSNYETGKFLSFTSDPEKAILFNSAEEAAEKIGIGKLRKAGKAKFIRAETLAEQAKEKNYCLYISGGTMAGRYPTKRSRSAVYSTLSKDRAKQFAKRSEAIRWANSYRSRLEPGNITAMQIVNLKDGTREDIM